ncbi:hypothetical protein AAC387_Pa04g1237 [Persea americana]
MSSASRTRSSGPVLPITNTLHRPIPPSRRFHSSTTSTSFASSSSTFSHSPSPSFLHRPSSPTRVSIPSVRFSIDRPISPSRSVVCIPHTKAISTPPTPRRSCLCSPSTHPGSFRCSLHKNQTGSSNAVSSPSNQLNARRSAMKNSLVRIGTVEGGDWVKRALSSLIRPSSHQQKRRAGFQPRPSRLSILSTAEGCRS